MANVGDRVSVAFDGTVFAERSNDGVTFEYRLRGTDSWFTEDEVTFVSEAPEELPTSPGTKIQWNGEAVPNRSVLGADGFWWGYQGWACGAKSTPQEILTYGPWEIV